MSENPNEQATAPDLVEYATNVDGRDITRGFIDGLDYLRPQDEVLRLRCQGDWRIYEELLRDDRVFSAFSQRKDAVLSRELKVDPGGESAIDKEAADFIRATIERLKFDAVTDKMLSGIFFGFAVAECIWDTDGKTVELADLRVRKQRRFRFAQDGTLKLITGAHPDGEPMPPRKFWTFSTGADNDDEPYGRGLAHYLFWPVFFKRNALKFWMAFLDKFGTPTTVAEAPVGTSESDCDKLLEITKAVHRDTGVVVPQGVVLRYLESARAAGGDFGVFVDRMDAAISKIVLSQTMTTDDGSSLSQSKTHLSVRDQLLKADADLLCESFNRSVATWLTEWNHPGARPPKVWRVFEATEDLAARAQRDAAIAQIGYRPTIDAIAETYGGEWEEMPQQQPAMAPVFAEPDPAPLIKGEPDPKTGLAPRLASDAQPILGRMLDSVRDVVMSARSLDEIPQRILDLDLDADIELLTSIVREAMIASRLLGMAEVRDEAVKAAAK